jgi:hypothetical protein
METVKKVLPNSTATLVLGILSIVTCWLYGVIGIVFAIIALVISKKPMDMYQESPDEYEGHGNLKAGRIMSIIGLSLSGLYLVLTIIAFAILGVAAFSLGSMMEAF